MLIDRPSVSRSIFNKKERLDNYILMKVENLLCATYSTGMQLRWTKDCWGNQNIFYSELLTVWGQTELYLEQCITAQLVECVRMTVEPLMGAWIFKIWPCRLTQCFIRCHDENSVMSMGLGSVFLNIVKCCPSSHSITAKIVKMICSPSTSVFTSTELSMLKPYICSQSGHVVIT